MDEAAGSGEVGKDGKRRRKGRRENTNYEEIEEKQEAQGHKKGGGENMRQEGRRRINNELP